MGFREAAGFDWDNRFVVEYNQVQGSHHRFEKQNEAPMRVEYLTKYMFFNINNPRDVIIYIASRPP